MSAECLPAAGAQWGWGALPWPGSCTSGLLRACLGGRGVCAGAGPSSSHGQCREGVPSPGAGCTSHRSPGAFLTASPGSSAQVPEKCQGGGTQQVTGQGLVPRLTGPVP